MKAFAAAALGCVSVVSARRTIFDKYHEFIDEKMPEIRDDAQPLIDEIEQDLHDLKDLVHEKADTYMSLFDDLKNRVKDDLVYDQPSLAGNEVSSSIKKSTMGCLVEQTIYDNQYIETQVTAPAVDFLSDYVQQTEHLKQATQKHKDLVNGDAPPTVWTCDNREPDGSP